VSAAGRVVFSGTEVCFPAVSIANTAHHKPASPAARCACCFRKKKQQKLVKQQNKISDPQNFSFFSVKELNQYAFALNQLCFYFLNYFF
jgi:hypothetical protein